MLQSVPYHQIKSGYAPDSLTQIVDFPTRNNNILDIFITNRPSLLKQCYPQPGISDHEIVYVVSYIKAPLYQGHKWNLYNWTKAD